MIRDIEMLALLIEAHRLAGEGWLARCFAGCDMDSRRDFASVEELREVLANAFSGRGNRRIGAVSAPSRKLAGKIIEAGGSAVTRCSPQYPPRILAELGEGAP